MKRSPAAALWLSACPGVGHVYLGQPQKGFVLILSVASAFVIADRGSEGFIPIALFLWIAGAIDAYRSAQELNHLIDTGQPIPRSSGAGFSMSKWWGWALIVIGAIFFLDNFGWFNIDWILDFWPLGLIALGVYILRGAPGSPEPERATTTATAAPPPLPAEEPEPTESHVGPDGPVGTDGPDRSDGFEPELNVTPSDELPSERADELADASDERRDDSGAEPTSEPDRKTET